MSDSKPLDLPSVHWVVQFTPPPLYVTDFVRRYARGKVSGGCSESFEIIWIDFAVSIIFPSFIKITFFFIIRLTIVFYNKNSWK